MKKLTPTLLSNRQGAYATLSRILNESSASDSICAGAGRTCLHCSLPVVLGDDEGFEPYRAIGGLIFCQPRVADIQAGIEAALMAPGVNMDEVQRAFPAPEPWIASLLGAANKS